jgi:chromosome partitioning protein
LPAKLEALAGAGFAYAIVDTPPAITDAIRAVVALADLVVIPVKPSPHDLRAVGRTVEIVQAEGKDFCFVLTQAKGNALLTVQAVAALSAHGVVSPAVMHDRVDYAASMTDGRTVQETDPRGRSAAEMAQLWDFVKGRMAKARKHERQKPHEGHEGCSTLIGPGGDQGERHSRRYANQGRPQGGPAQGERRRADAAQFQGVGCFPASIQNLCGVARPQAERFAQAKLRELPAAARRLTVVKDRMNESTKISSVQPPGESRYRHPCVCVGVLGGAGVVALLSGAREVMSGGGTNVYDEDGVLRYAPALKAPVKRSRALVSRILSFLLRAPPARAWRQWMKYG